MVKHLVTRANVCRFELPVKLKNLNLYFIINPFKKVKKKNENTKCEREFGVLSCLAMK
jgi:hypothetical protein